MSMAAPPSNRTHWRPEMGRCPHPKGGNKRSFQSRHLANCDARNINGTAYRCQYCGHYHVTSYPPRVNAAITLLLRSLKDDVRKGKLHPRDYYDALGRMRGSEC